MSSIWETPRLTWRRLPGVAALLDVLCPPRCCLCGADMADGGDGVMVCDACRGAIAREPPRCAGCGMPGGSVACRCAGRRRDWDGIAILSGYGDPVRSGILRAKRPGGEHVAAALAALLVARHRSLIDSWRIDVVVPVPMHWRRRLVRGVSAAGQAAVGVARSIGRPCRSLVWRRRATPMQNELPFEDRRGNVRNAVVARRRTCGRRILLVDDVTTTGATLAECRRALVEAGAAAVYAAALARADRGGDAGGP